MKEKDKTSKFFGLPLEIFVLIVIILATLLTPIPYDELIPVLLGILMLIKRYKETGEVSENSVKGLYEKISGW